MKKMKPILALGLALAIALPLWGCRKETPASTTAPSTTAPRIIREKLAEIEPAVLFDQDGIRITAEAMVQTDLGGEITVTVVNDTQRSISYTAADLIVNGLTITDGFSITAPAGQTAHGAISISYRSMDASAMTNIATVSSPDARIMENDEHNTLYTAPFSIETSLAGKYKPELETGTVTYEKDGLCITVLGVKPNTRTTTVRLLVSNAAMDHVSIKAENIKADGKDVTAWLFDTIYAGTSRYCSFELGGTNITEVSLDIDVYSVGDVPALLYHTGNHTLRR